MFSIRVMFGLKFVKNPMEIGQLVPKIKQTFNLKDFTNNKKQRKIIRFGWLYLKKNSICKFRLILLAHSTYVKSLKCMYFKRVYGLIMQFSP